MIAAHGATYQTVAEANARIAELNEENLRIGASDGRVTEIMCIMDALEAHEVAERKADAEARIAAEKAEKATRAEAARPKLDSTTAGYVMEAERRIRSIEADKSRDDGQWRYLKTQDDGRIVVRREYKTELGFLRAYVREARRGHDIIIAE